MNYDKVKRILDIGLSSLSMILLSPILIAVGMAIKLDSEGSILFKQKRVGKNGKEFHIYKFRTMVKDNNVDDLSKKDKVTGIGRVLRQTGIDELPQLFNVLKGDMSLIGPRPISSRFYDYMTEEQKLRVNVKPGLLGPIKCTIDSTSMVDRINEDLFYVKNHSLINDIKIIVEFLLKYKKIVSNRKNSSYGNKENIVKQIEILRENANQIYNVEKYQESYTPKITTHNFNNNNKHLKKVLVLVRKNND